VSAPGRLTRRCIRPFTACRASLALLLFGSSGCDLPGRPGAADRSPSARNERSFDVLFRRNCAGCHGALGKLGPAPPLNDKLFLALISDDELKQVIYEGRPGTLMPAFAADKGGSMTAEQVFLLAEGIRSRWGSIEDVPVETPPYHPEARQPDRSAAIEGGLRVFARACASCHGDRGQGGTYAGEPDGKPVGAVNVPEFLALMSDQALRRLIITGRSDLGMPNSNEGQGRPEGYKPLTSHEVTELVSLLAA
jgi:cytochrome c oxidase cbb3-type subunit III